MKGINEYLKIKIHLCIGGNNLMDDKRMFEEGAQVVVGTPGRVVDVIKRRNLSTSFI